MMHICGMRDLALLAPDLESWNCQGCTRFLLKQLWFPWISALEVGRIPGPVFSSLWSWCGLAQAALGQDRVREESSGLAPHCRKWICQLCWALTSPVYSGKAAVSSPLMSQYQTDTDEVSRESQWSLACYQMNPTPKKAFFIWIEPLLAPVGRQVSLPWGWRMNRITGFIVYLLILYFPLYREYRNADSG